MKEKIYDSNFKTASASRWPPNVGKRCVEVKRTKEGVIVRDSKNQNGPILTFTSDEWQAFLEGVKLKEFEVYR